MLKKWPRSTTPIDIWRFFSLESDYRMFVESFSSIVATLTKLT